MRALPVLAVLIGCSAPTEPAGVWIRGVGPFGDDHELVGHAFVVASQPDFCDRFRSRWADYTHAWDEHNAALTEAGDDTEARCDAVLQYWRDRADAERKLWFRNASYLKLFRAHYGYWRSSDGLPTEAGRPQSGVYQLEDAGPWMVSAQTAHRLPTEPWDIEPDCSAPLIQEGIENIRYPGPPRELWRAASGRLVVERTETAWAVSIDDAELEFVQEVSYRLPTEDDPAYVVKDRERRDPRALELDHEFVRCDVEVDERMWWPLSGWASGEGW